MTDYTTLDGPALLEVCGDNAHKWADAFCQHATKWGFVPDVSLMTTWFANAIEHSTLVRERRAVEPMVNIKVVDPHGNPI